MEKIGQLNNTEANPDAFKWDFELQEQMKRPIYCGFFVDSQELQEKCTTAGIVPSLEKPVALPHITTTFRPSEENVHPELLGEKVAIEALGYGNDGKNEGLLVALKSANEDVRELCDKIPVAHITLSVSVDGKPADTAKLDFQPLNEGFELTGTYGMFTEKHDVITDKNKQQDM